MIITRKLPLKRLQNSGLVAAAKWMMQYISERPGGDGARCLGRMK